MRDYRRKKLDEDFDLKLIHPIREDPNRHITEEDANEANELIAKTVEK